MKSDVRAWFKNQVSNQNLLSTGSVLFDRVYKIPLGSTTLIRSEPYAGCTAILLELTKALTSNNHFVFYADIQDVLLEHRMHGIDLANLQIIKPTSSTQLKEFVNSISSRNIPAVYILDGINFVETENFGKIDLDHIASEIKNVDPNSTLICSRRKKGIQKPVWNKVLDIKHLKNVYSKIGEEELVGHTLEISCDGNKVEHYIEHVSGRLSRGFEEGILLMESGIPKNGLFTKDGITERGFRNFIDEYDRWILNGNQGS